MRELEVNIPSSEANSYAIHIGCDMLDSLWDKLEERYGDYQKIVVTDANLVAAGHLKSLIGDRDVNTFVIDPPGEVSKYIETVVAIVESMEKAFMGRDSLIVALGGGTVGDISGFAGAIFKRGVKVVQIPTTTVAQADSSVGGKTGVDSSISKNAFGAFWQPDAVYIDVATLKTLDDRQYRAGLAETVKHALIANCDYFAFLEQNMGAILNKDSDVLEEIAFRNCSIKAAVVEEDPTEKNKRRILNYGHTIGHAVESASSFELLHGEAVAIGMVGAGLIEKELGLGDDARIDKVKKVLGKLGMDLSIPAEISKEELVKLIKRDKKAVNQWPKFVLLNAIGEALCADGQWAHDVSADIVDSTLDQLY